MRCYMTGFPALKNFNDLPNFILPVGHFIKGRLSAKKIKNIFSENFRIKKTKPYP